MAKRGPGTYRTDGRATAWLKIKNLDYTLMRDRHELFEARGPQGEQRPASSAPSPRATTSGENRSRSNSRTS